VLLKSKLVFVAGAVSAVALAPAVAQGSTASSNGVVLKVERGGATITLVDSKGRVAKRNLATKAPAAVGAGTRVAVGGGRAKAKGRTKKTRIRAKVVRSGGRVALVASNGSSLKGILGGAKLATSKLTVGDTVAVTVSFAANRTAKMSLVMPGDAPGTYGTYPSYPTYPSDPTYPSYPSYPSYPTYPTPDPATCESGVIQGRVLAIKRSASKLMIELADGTRAVYTAPAESLADIKRGNVVVVTDSDSDNVAEAVVAVAESASNLRGRVVWIDTEWGAFGVRGRNGVTVAVNATECQLAALSEGDRVAVTTHEDADGELIADSIDTQSTYEDEGGWRHRGHHRGGHHGFGAGYGHAESPSDTGGADSQDDSSYTQTDDDGGTDN